jgi:hypothetical protein
MIQFGIVTETGTIMSALAMVCSLIMILVALRYRRKFLLLATPAAPLPTPIGLRRSQRPRGEDSAPDEVKTKRKRMVPGRQPRMPAASGNRTYRYRQAEEMLGQGFEGRQIRKQCGLRKGEYDLLTGLQQLQHELKC